MSEDREFEELEDYLRKARLQTAHIRDMRKLRDVAKDSREVSEDYAARLAEKATFRRLLSDEALDGVRFRWLWKIFFAREAPGINQDDLTKIRTVDDLRKYIDSRIANEQSSRGPSA